MTSRLCRKKKNTSAPLSTKTNSEQSSDASLDTESSKRAQAISDPLDESSADFSGGCSQFTYTAAKALSKVQASKGSRKRKDGDSSRAKQTRTAKDSLNSKKAPPDNKNTASASGTNAEQQEDIADKEITSSRAEDARDNNDIREKKCPTCSSVILAAQFSDHTTLCLRNKFQRKLPPKDGLLFCQICQQELTELSDVERQAHYNGCLDSGASSSTAPSAPSAPSTSSVIYTELNQNRCHICHKNLSHLNTTRKLQHVNKCMDQAEALAKHERERKEAVEKARNRVLDCPLCGQQLKTSNSRQVHIKKCGRQYNIPGDQVLASVRQQEEDHARLLEAGILPQQQKRRGRPKKTTAENGISTAPTTTSATRPPSIRVDEDTALAIALSNSLREQDNKRASINDFSLPPDRACLSEVAGGDIQYHEDCGKDAFSILMSQTPAEKVKKKRKKKGQERVPLLLVQTALQGRDKLERRLSEIIIPLPMAMEDQPLTPEFPKSRVCDKYDQFDGDKEKENLRTNPCAMWKNSALLLDSKHDFYVPSLLPVVERCTLKAGSKIKRMNQIPGWKPLVTEETTEAPSTETEKLSKANETFLVSTQTAVLLAELADGNVTNLSTQDQTRLLNETCAIEDRETVERLLNQTGGFEDKAAVEKLLKKLNVTRVGEEETVEKKAKRKRESLGMLEDQPTGFYEEQEESSSTAVPDHHIKQLQDDFGCMVDNELASDISISVKDGEPPVHAHSFILAARCSLMYQCVNDSRLDLSQHSRSAVLALLQYLYTADIKQIKIQAVAEVQELANRFQISKLAAHCSKMASSNDLDNDLDLDTSHTEVEKDMQKLLKEMWGSDEEDEESNEDEKVDQKEEEEEEEEELDDLYAFMATQKVKKCMESEDEKEEEESNEDTEETEQEEKEELDEQYLFSPSQRKKSGDNEDEKLDKERIRDDNEMKQKQEQYICSQTKEEEKESDKVAAHSNCDNDKSSKDNIKTSEKTSRTTRNNCDTTFQPTSAKKSETPANIEGFKQALDHSMESQMDAATFEDLMVECENQSDSDTKEGAKTKHNIDNDNAPQSNSCRNNSPTVESTVKERGLALAKATNSCRNNSQTDKAGVEEHLPISETERATTPILFLTQQQQEQHHDTSLPVVVIESDSDADNSGSELFDSYTSEKAMDIEIVATEKVPQENEEEKIKTLENGNNDTRFSPPVLLKGEEKRRNMKMKRSRQTSDTLDKDNTSFSPSTVALDDDEKRNLSERSQLSQQILDIGSTDTSFSPSPIFTTQSNKRAPDSVSPVFVTQVTSNSSRTRDSGNVCVNLMDSFDTMQNTEKSVRNVDGKADAKKRKRGPSESDPTSSDSSRNSERKVRSFHSKADAKNRKRPNESDPPSFDSSQHSERNIGSSFSKANVKKRNRSPSESDLPSTSKRHRPSEIDITLKTSNHVGLEIGNEDTSPEIARQDTPLKFRKNFSPKRLIPDSITQNRITSKYKETTISESDISQHNAVNVEAEEKSTPHKGFAPNRLFPNGITSAEPSPVFNRSSLLKESKQRSSSNSCKMQDFSKTSLQPVSKVTSSHSRGSVIVSPSKTSTSKTSPSKSSTSKTSTSKTSTSTRLTLKTSTSKTSTPTSANTTGHADDVPSAVVDLTHDEEKEENEEDVKLKLKETSMDSSMDIPLNLNTNAFDVFEGYEEPEAYHELDFMLPSQSTPHQEKIKNHSKPVPLSPFSESEELPDLRSRISAVISLDKSPRKLSSKSQDDVLQISSKVTRTKESQKESEKNRKEVTANEERNGDSTARKTSTSTSSHQTSEEDGTMDKEKQDVDTTSQPPKSRKLKKFNFVSQKSQKFHNISSGDTDLQLTSHSSSRTLAQNEDCTNSQASESGVKNQPEMPCQSKTLEQSRTKNTKATNICDQSVARVGQHSKKPTTPRSSHETLDQSPQSKEEVNKSQDQSWNGGEAFANFEATFGSDDDGVLNMVMDEVEGKLDEDDEFDPPTDVSMNVSVLEKSAVHPNLLKTPSIPPAQRKKPLSEWKAPSPFTPMPSYDNMKTPDLKQQCSRLGVRPLPKKNMLKVLKDIYAQTHQYETDSDYEQPSPSSIQTDQSEPTTHVTNQKKGKRSKTDASTTAKTGQKKTGAKKKQKEMVVSSDEETDQGLNDSFEAKSSGTDLPEETICCSPTSSPISKRDIAYKHKQVWDYIKSHEELYLRILHYEPLEFDEFHQELKATGISLGKSLLMDFLDDKCVQFSLRGSRKARSPRKGRRGSPKKPRGSPKRPRGRGRWRGRGSSQIPSTQR